MFGSENDDEYRKQPECVVMFFTPRMTLELMILLEFVIF